MHCTETRTLRSVCGAPGRLVAFTLMSCLLAMGCTGVIPTAGDGSPTSGTGLGPDGAGSSSGGGPVGSGPVPGASSIVTEPMHRLNRLEYNNTVRDLLGTTLSPAATFPPDPGSDGLDNLASALTLDPALMDLYIGAAKDLAAATLDSRPRLLEQVIASQPGNHQGGSPLSDWGWLLEDGKVLASVTVPVAETAKISVLAGGSASKVENPKMTLLLDGRALKSWSVDNQITAPALFTVTAALSAGKHEFTVTFDNRKNDAPSNNVNQLAVGYIEVKGEVVISPSNRALVYTCDPATAADQDGCYRSIVTGFAARAWRRPLLQAEADEVMALWQKLGLTESKDDAVKLTVRALLVSPKFLFRVSIPGAYSSPSLAGLQNALPLDDYSLASRLSYFLWSSMPDQALFDDAKSGALREGTGLQSALTRMMADPKAAGLVDGFAEQWLQVRVLKTRSAPDATAFPEFDAALKQAMAEEAKLFFRDFLSNGRPLAEMIAPTFGFLNDRLAVHYGLAKPGSPELARVDLPAGARGGLVMQAAWLTATSESTRTSPVKRGRFVLEELLCAPVPPPPDNIPAFEEPAMGATVRESLAAHRKSPACSGCHNLLDPMGLGLEDMDATGALRTMEAGKPVDASGAMVPDNTPFVGAAQFSALLKDDPRFATCLSRKLMTYGLGRKFDDADSAFADAIAAALPGQGFALDKLIQLIVLSPAFRGRSANLTE